MKIVLGVIAMVLWVSSVLLTPGCGPGEAEAAQAAEPRDLSFAIVNNSGDTIKSIGLEGANLPMSFRPIEDGGSSSIKNRKLELPEKLTLHWSDKHGDRHEGSVRVWGELGSTYSGQVTLTISRSNKVVLTGD